MGEKRALSWRTFTLPKRGNSAEEYEDACAGDPRTGRFAVADGASESSYANVWARLLVEGFVRPPVQEKAEGDWLEPLRRQWAADVDGRELAWYGEEKREQGAFATFLGLQLLRSKEGGGGRWKASAVGDSCVFQVRQDTLLVSFPLSRSADFGTRPALLGSRAVRAETSAAAQPKVEWGRWQRGDRFFLMTDALAQWFLARHEGKRRPWQSLAGRLAEPKGEGVLTTYLEQLRDRKEIKNDDITLVAVGPLV